MSSLILEAVQEISVLLPASFFLIVNISNMQNIFNLTVI